MGVDSGPSLKQKKKKAKGVPLQLVEYGAAASLLFLVHLIPFSLIRLLSSLLGRLFFRFGRRRRSIALENLNHAFPHKKAEEVERIARESFVSLVLTFLESSKFRRVFTGPVYRRRLARQHMRPAGDHAKAAEEWQKVLDLVPDDPEALEGLTEIYRAQNTGDLLAQVLRRRLGMEEEPARRVALLRDLAQVQEERLKDAAGAMSTLRRLLELDGRDREALSRLDRLCVRNEKWVELADVLAREAVAAESAGDRGGAAAFRFRLAELKETRLLDREGAVALYEDILAAQPDHAEAVGRLQALLQRDPQNARAAAALQRAYEAAGAWQKYAAVLEGRAADRPRPHGRPQARLEERLAATLNSRCTTP